MMAAQATRADLAARVEALRSDITALDGMSTARAADLKGPEKAAGLLAGPAGARYLKALELAGGPGAEGVLTGITGAIDASGVGADFTDPPPVSVHDRLYALAPTGGPCLHTG